ncbi:hypothetical protein FHW17_003782 [Phyllobacterium sp. P30BS-XVII]|nr:hypothetical protein [Phyllobacterium sp. P30BS-XVII]
MANPACAYVRTDDLISPARRSAVSALLSVLMRVAAIAVTTILGMLALYGWLLPALHVQTPYALAIGVLVSAVMAFYVVRRTHSLLPAFVGALGVALLVGYISMVLLLNIFGS